MASLFCRNGFWYLRLKTSSGKWIKIATKTRDRATALALLGQVEKERLTRAIPPARKPLPSPLAALGSFPEGSLGQYALYFVDDKNYRDNARTAISKLRNYILALGHIPLNQLTPVIIRDWVSDLKKRGLHPNSIFGIYNFLSAILKQAKVDGIIKDSPCVIKRADCGKVIIDKDRYHVATVPQVQEIINKVDIDERFLFFVFGFLTGARVGEVSGIMWQDIDFSVQPLPKIRIARSFRQPMTKTGVVRYMPMHPVLQHFLLARQKKEGLVFWSPKGYPTQQSSLYAQWRAIGLEGFRIHDLRHSFISMTRHFCSRPEITRLWTHAEDSRDIMSVYSHWTWEDDCAQIIKLPFVVPFMSQKENDPHKGLESNEKKQDTESSRIVQDTSELVEISDFTSFQAHSATPKSIEQSQFAPNPGDKWDKL